MVGIFHGDVSHNQMVHLNHGGIMGKLYGKPPLLMTKTNYFYGNFQYCLVLLTSLKNMRWFVNGFRMTSHILTDNRKYTYLGYL